jgi:hypothetical protein
MSKDTEALNSQTGEHEEEQPETQDELSDLFDEEQEEAPDEDAIALKRLNEITGKTYKSLEDVAKSEKERDKLFALKGKQDAEEDPKPKQPKGNSTGITPDVAEELLTVKHPEASEVLNELKEESQRTGKDVLSLFRASTYFQNEAKARYEAKEREEKNGEKVNAPTSFIVGKSISFEKLDLGNKDHTAWLRAKEGRTQAYNEWLKLNYKKL